MSRYGQKRCSYCNHYGHNRRTCPDRSPDSKAARKQALADHRASYGKPPVGSNRKCSQCGETGHNRKTCNEYKRLGVLAKDLILRQAEVTRKLMNKHGITVGAVIVKSEKKYDRANGSYDMTVEPVETTHIITKIEWKNFLAGDVAENLAPIIQTKRLGNPDVMGTFEDGTKRPVQVPNMSYEKARPGMLSGLTIEKYKEINDSSYVYPGSMYYDCVHTLETKEESIAAWKNQIVLGGYDEDYQTRQLKDLTRQTEECLMILPGCVPIEKLSNKAKKELTMGRAYERMYIDGTRNKPFDKRRIERIECFVKYLETVAK